MVWWIVLAAGAFALVFFSNKGANAVWGTATLGVVVGIVLHFIYPGAFWWTMGRAVPLQHYAEQFLNCYRNCFQSDCAIYS